MRLSLLLITLVALALLPGFARADDRCRAIVTATVAELRAGAAAWDDAIEALARTAAGSACVKAFSGSYGAAETTTGGEASVAATAAGPTPQTTAAESAAEAPEEATDPEEKEGKAGWKFLGFEVNEISGSPGKKPYERRRSQ